MASNFIDEFGPFDGHIWFNSASEGPLPKCAVAAVEEAVRWKINPHELTLRRFQEVPARLKAAAAPILGVEADDVILGNSATYGLQILADGLSFSSGDEILTMQNDFPVDILPWFARRADGVRVIQLRPAAPIANRDEIEAAFTRRTKLVCLSHVHTFSGHVLDVDGIGSLCRERGIPFVLNVTQSAGNRPLRVADWPVDAVTSSGFKWLCGPYGTGLAWIRPEWRRQLRPRSIFWANTLGKDDFDPGAPLSPPEGRGSRQYDVFGTANFFNFMPLTASLEFLHSVGLDRIATHLDELQERFLIGLDRERYRLISPEARDKRSALIFFSHARPQENIALLQGLNDAGIHLGFWQGNLRVSPHLFNSVREIDRLLEVLHEQAGG